MSESGQMGNGVSVSRRRKSYFGLLRYEKKPSQFAEALALLLRAQGKELLYFEPQDIRLKNETIHGRVFDGCSWSYRVRGIPEYIEAAPAFFFSSSPYAPEREYLEANSHLIHADGYVSNTQLQRGLRSNPAFSSFALNYRTIRETDSLKKFLRKRDAAVVKPNVGIFDGELFVVRKDGEESYSFSWGANHAIVSAGELEDFCALHFFDRRYIVQDYVDTTSSVGGFPFTISSIFTHGLDGAWKKLSSQAKIGYGQVLVSNKCEGQADFRRFLLANRTAAAVETACTHIEFLEDNLPGFIEEQIGKKSLDLEATFGVRPDGSVAVLSVDLFPNMRGLDVSFAEERAGFLTWVVKHSGDKSK